MPSNDRTLIRVPRDLKHALILHRIRAGIAAKKPVVSQSSVDQVERTLGVSLPQELLAVFAATGRDPYEMVVLTEELREEDDSPQGLVAVSLDHRLAKTSHLPAYWCLELVSGRPGPCTMTRWSLNPRDRKDGLSVLDFVRACYLDGSPTAEEAIAISGLAARFRAMVVSEPRLSFRRVTHHRFGSGFVLREFNDGNHKVEVEFPTVGTKLLLASYVEDASPPEGHRVGGKVRRTPRRTRQ